MSELNFLKLFEDIDQIKHQQREGWKKHDIDGVKDTIASHSFGTAIIGWIVAEKHDLDSDKMVKMLLIHDLIMAYIPDLVPEESNYSSKRELEMEKTDELIEKLPEEIKEEFKDLFEEFQEEDTEFSKVAREADKIETLLQSLIYSDRIDEDITGEFLEFYEEEFETDLGKEIFREIEKLS